MAKIQTVGSIKDFMSGEWKLPKASANEGLNRYGRPVFSIDPVTLGSAMATGEVIAASGSGIDSLYPAIMNLFDAGVVLVIVFAGACWIFNQRSKSLEILIGVCAGFILARHAIDIRDWLKKI